MARKGSTARKPKGKGSATALKTEKAKFVEENVERILEEAAEISKNVVTETVAEEITVVEAEEEDSGMSSPVIVDTADVEDEKLADSIQAYDSYEIAYSSDDEAPSDDDDEAPEAVSVKTTRDNAILALAEAKEKEQKQIADDKKRRRAHNARLTAQQEEKKARLVSKLTRLPEELLEAAERLDEEEEASGSQTRPEGTHTRLREEDSDDEGSSPRTGKRRKAVNEGERIVGQFRVVARNAVAQKPAADPKVLEFRQKQLFGDRVKRGNAIANASAAQRSHGPAAFFVRS
ncbi:hypothetical protein DFS34DRAFT_599255 [Phlyctochytrium arcticum]|nr:hypothetical protein DFS34DRAFT_599255 [Phlyctochytrium arcticum]